MFHVFFVFVFLSSAGALRPGAMGSNRITAAQLQFGNVVVLALACAVDVFVLAKMKETIESPR